MKYFYLYLTLFSFFISCGDGSGDNCIKYAVVGASDALAFGASSPSQGYVSKIQDSLNSFYSSRSRSVCVSNFGELLAKTDYFQEIEAHLVNRIGPDIITIWAGGNDFVSYVPVPVFSKNLRLLFSRIKQNKDAVIAVMNLPNMLKVPRVLDDAVVLQAKVLFLLMNKSQPFKNASDSLMLFEKSMDSSLILFEKLDLDYRDSINSIVEEFEYNLVNLYDVNFPQEFISSDGFHPNDKGYALMSDLFLKSLISSLSN